MLRNTGLWLRAEANDFGGGWGNVVRIGHKMRPSDSAIYMESLYAHLLNFGITTGDTLRRGDFIGRIGNANGAYPAHLHLEIRDTLGLPLGGGYSQHTRVYLAPTIFIKNNRACGRFNRSLFAASQY